MVFRVHYEDQNGDRHVESIQAGTPEEAIKVVRKQRGNIKVLKTKVDRS